MISLVPYHPRLDEGIRALFQISMPADIAISLEREPCYYTACKIQCEDPEVIVAIEADMVWAVANIGYRSVWYKGEVVKVRYLSDLRIHPQKQKSRLLLLIVNEVYEKLCQEKLPAQTVIFTDNKVMLKVIKKNLKGPRYHQIGGLTSFIFPVRKRRKLHADFKIWKASNEDIPILQRFFNYHGSKIDYFPAYNFNQLNTAYYHHLDIHDYYLVFEGADLVGCTGIWDIKAMKQTRIAFYSDKMRLIKPFYNIYSMLTKGQPLPQEGSILNYLYLHSILIRNRDPNIFDHLLAYIMNDLDGKHSTLFCALSDKDPLQEVLRKNKKSIKNKGLYFLVSHKDSLDIELHPEYFYLEAARI